MPSRCKFTLNHPDHIYIANEDVIEGVVELITTNPKEVLRIAACGFRRQTTVGGQIVGNKESRSEFGVNYFTSEERMTKCDKIVFRRGILRADLHTWTFSFHVNRNCLTSMEGKAGYIRYQMSLKIYNKSKYNNVFTLPITVIKRHDLNGLRVSLLPRESLISSTFCCGLFRAGPLIIVSAFFRGYAPGQRFRYHLRLCNKVPVKQYDLEITFFRRSKFISNHPAKSATVFKTIFHHSRPTTTTQSDSQNIAGDFVIPPTQPTTISEFIRIKYFFSVKLKVSCCPRAFESLVPIEIGTVPLRDTLKPENLQDLVEFRPGQFTMAPRSYERPEEHDKSYINERFHPINRIDNFLPSYPMFRDV